MSIIRRMSDKVIVGDPKHGYVGIGGGAPVALQTMTSERRGPIAPDQRPLAGRHSVPHGTRH